MLNNLEDVGLVCLYVCMSVCQSDDKEVHFRTSSTSAGYGNLVTMRNKFMHEGQQVKVKVTGAKMV